ncbi:MAG TPA: LPS export ABC transporter ATP-binding protein [Candidatus Hydrothermia bacterium]|nr:LPS export ABC transporter ATP-binding protein [Candidatus Hydrothermae bacterium]HOK23048.1 LPS export ABC transporter ATP-binding protein [Candidatus Hydrothermia bacterium]HOL23692.1 LPS export ABC transporter ATP-binding protein [Candidatus Hydrothermia bacterium]HPO78697.1 LPS export ABC transporter ATP-binding protein [Candidatus Hydrothermia bacterium]HRD22966.1 LPS export ABC transporter ATP-binding protein [Candidatus Hydrothermia bacterium]
MAVLRTKNLHKSFGKKEVVKGVNISVKNGEIVGLLGPNGAGKTTIFYMIMGEIVPDSGKIFIDDLELTHLPMYKRARLGLSYLPQEPSIFQKLSVFDNIYAILEYRGLPREEAMRLTEDHLKMMEIYHLKDQPAYTLSGGERRRLEIARALALNPKMLLLDEPFTGVDPKTRQEIQDIILNLKKIDIGILMTDHNVRETLEITDRAYIIYNGEILIEGNSQELIVNEEARKIYLGERFKL